ncbi:MAG TPA: hypothetical protein VMF89_17325, partial [Polyangiales bacterium]|nr:hypothetical protein [Polyangiales bacterium]
MMKSQLFIFGAVMLCLLGGSVCSAQGVLTSEYRLTSTYQAPTESMKWYGWQTLTADVASVGLTALGVYLAADGAGSSAGWGVIAAGLISYTAITPLLHLSHGNLWMIGSLLLRAAVIATT